METTQPGHRACRVPAAQHRTGNNTVFTLFRFASQQRRQVRPKQRANQTRLGCLRAADGNNAFCAQLTRGEQLTDSDHVLIIKMPDLFRQAYRLQEMNMRSHQPGRMRAGKFIKGYLPLRMPAQLTAAGLADMHFARRQAR